MEWYHYLPAVNATLNGIVSVLLVAALIAIKSGRKTLHKRLMLSACTASVLFLVSYVVYHNLTGMTKFLGTGWSRTVYYFILATHVPLAALVVPFVSVTLFFGLTEKYERHKKIARWTWPIWLYVAITGVLVYFFLYQWFPSSRG